MLRALKFDRVRSELRHVAATFGLVAILTALLVPIIEMSGLHRGSVVYLIPVLIAATRWGIVSAVVAAVCGVLASALFFYEPLYSLRIRDPHEVLNLILFIIVAVVVSQLATRLKRELELSRQREIDMRDLYAFSRRLAVAFDVSDIHAAIEDRRFPAVHAALHRLPGVAEDQPRFLVGKLPREFDPVARLGIVGEEPRAVILRS